MKISLKWLNEYVDVADYFSQPEELGKILTAAGLEIEGIEDLSTPYKNVVVGHLLSVDRHPNADRLTLCQVSTGGGVVHQIVCGATNHKTGDNVVAALPGALLPGDFAIKRSKIRDVESAGMLCSESELGLKKEAQGILLLPADAPIGENFAQYWGLDDIVFEVNVTPNRADCLSHLGLAREISALTGRPVHMPELNIHRHSFKTPEFVEVQLNDSTRAPRYAGCVVKNVKVTESPQWLKSRLERVGMNSINNVVDITNFVLMELGQPLHAFDLKELQGSKIIIDRATEGEKFTTLDGTEVTLKSDDLTIRDASRVVALAGVVGGKNSGVSESTQDVFVECAYFRPEFVRRSSRRLGIDTDSSYRFSRGVNPEGVEYALNRACQLLQDLAHGEVASAPLDLYPEKVVRSPIEVSLSTINDRLGFSVSGEEFSQSMMKLGCVVKPFDDGQRFEIVPPLWRMDIEQEIDFVEEMARFAGFDKIPEKVPVLDESPRAHDPKYAFEKLVKSTWASQGYFEAVNYGFVKSSEQSETLGSSEVWKAYGLGFQSESVRLMNPLNEDLNEMRQSLLVGLLKNWRHNINRGQNVGSLFEVGPAILGQVGDEFKEESRLSVISWGRSEELWKTHEKTPRIYELKAQVENYLRAIKARNYTWKVIDQAPPCFHPGQTVGLHYEGKMVGLIGSIHPRLKDDVKFRGDVVLGEFNLTQMSVGQPRTFKFQSVSSFPPIERDLAFVIPATTPAADVAAVIKKAAGPLCQGVEVFDVFTGGNLPSGMRSVAFRMAYQDKEKTLEDAEIQKIQTSIIQKVKEQLGFELR